MFRGYHSLDGLRSLFGPSADDRLAKSFSYNAYPEQQRFMTWRRAPDRLAMSYLESGQAKLDECAAQAQMQVGHDERPSNATYHNVADTLREYVASTQE